MRVARSLLAVAVVATGFVWSTPSAGACTCIPPTDPEVFEGADAVFEGTVTSYEEISADLGVYTFDVALVYKGLVRETQLVYVPLEDETGCGIVVDQGPAIVFPRVIDSSETRAGFPIGDLAFDICHRSAEPGSLDLDPPVEPVAPIADASTTTTPLLRSTTAAEDLAEPVTGGSVLVIGFIAVGVVGAFIASRIARKSRET